MLLAFNYYEPVWWLMSLGLFSFSIILFLFGRIFGKLEGRIKILPFRLCAWGALFFIMVLVLKMTYSCACGALFGWHHHVNFDSSWAFLYPFALSALYLLAPLLTAFYFLFFWLGVGLAKTVRLDGETKKSLWLRRLIVSLKIFSIALCGGILCGWIWSFHAYDKYFAQPYTLLALILIVIAATLLWRKRWGIFYPIVLFLTLGFVYNMAINMPKNSERKVQIFDFDGYYSPQIDSYSYDENLDERDLESRNLTRIESFFFARHDYLGDWNLEKLKTYIPTQMEYMHEGKTKEIEATYLKSGDEAFASTLSQITDYINLLDNSDRTKALRDFLQNPDLVLMSYCFIYTNDGLSLIEICAFSDSAKAFYEMKMNFTLQKNSE